MSGDPTNPFQRRSEIMEHFADKDIEGMIDRLKAKAEEPETRDRKIIFDAAMHVFDNGTPGLTPLSRKMLAQNIALRAQTMLARAALAAEPRTQGEGE